MRKNKTKHKFRSFGANQERTSKLFPRVIPKRGLPRNVSLRREVTLLGLHLVDFISLSREVTLSGCILEICLLSVLLHSEELRGFTCLTCLCLLLFHVLLGSAAASEHRFRRSVELLSVSTQRLPEWIELRFPLAEALLRTAAPWHRSGDDTCCRTTGKDACSQRPWTDGMTVG